MDIIGNNFDDHINYTKNKIWNHFINYGQFENRIYRFCCNINNFPQKTMKHNIDREIEQIIERKILQHMDCFKEKINEIIEEKMSNCNPNYKDQDNDEIINHISNMITINKDGQTLLSSDKIITKDLVID